MLSQESNQGASIQNFDFLSNISFNEVIDIFKNLMREHGYGDVDVIADSMVHRFALPEDKSGEKNGWYTLTLASFPYGAFGSWKNGEKVPFFALKYLKHDKKIFVQNEHLKKELQRANLQRQSDRQKEMDEAAKYCEELFNLGSSDMKLLTKHDYIIQKGIIPVNIKLYKDMLLIPLYNIDAKLRGLQKIYKNADKRFISKIEKANSFFEIKAASKNLFICEGYATAISLYMATKAHVIAAMDCYNLEKIAPLIKTKYPEKNIIISADNDMWSSQNDVKKNVGLSHAKRASLKIKSPLIYPNFSKDYMSLKPTDFNDYHKIFGLSALQNTIKLQIEMQVTKMQNIKNTITTNDTQSVKNSEAQRAEKPVKQASHEQKIKDKEEQNEFKISDWGIEKYHGKAEKLKWLVDGFLPLSMPCLLCARGGTGKGMLSLDLALNVAGGEKTKNSKWLGKDITSKGAVVIITAEDSKTSIHQRLDAIDPTGERRKKAQGNLFIIPLPNAGGASPIIFSTPYGYKFSNFYYKLKSQLLAIPNLKLINIDPLSAFVSIDINKDPQAGQYTNSILAMLAEQTKSCVLIAHHMTKAVDKSEDTKEVLRNSIRGTSAIVDGVRLAFAISPARQENSRAKSRYNNQNIDLNSTSLNDLYECCVVKSNVPADMNIYKLYRQANGLLALV